MPSPLAEHYARHRLVGGGEEPGSPAARPRPTRRCKTPTASTRFCAATTRPTRPRWSSASPAAPGDLPAGRRGDHAQLGAGADRCLVLRRRLDPPHDRRADDPGRRDHPGAARQHRASGRRHPGPARPLLPFRAPPMSRRSTTCCPATCRSPTQPKLAQNLRGLRSEASRTGYWHNFRKFAVSLLRPGTAAGVDGERVGLSVDTKITGDHSQPPMMLAIRDGTIRGLFLIGQNPVVGGHNTHMIRQALPNLEWMVVRETFENEPPPTGTSRRRSSAASCGRRTSRQRCSCCRPRCRVRRKALSPIPTGEFI